MEGVRSSSGFMGLGSYSPLPYMIKLLGIVLCLVLFCPLQVDAAPDRRASDVSSGDVVSVSDPDLMYSDLDEFTASPIYVTRYEYEILKKLELIQYALLIMIALLFLLYFKRK